jgi:hypothetical protein
MSEIRDVIALGNQYHKRAGDLADMLRKSDWRFMDVRAKTAMYEYSETRFEALLYSDRHKREAQVVTHISNELLLDSSFALVPYLSRLMLSELEWQEAQL